MASTPRAVRHAMTLLSSAFASISWRPLRSSTSSFLFHTPIELENSGVIFHVNVYLNWTIWEWILGAIFRTISPWLSRLPHLAQVISSSIFWRCLVFLSPHMGILICRDLTVVNQVAASDVCPGLRVVSTGSICRVRRSKLRGWDFIGKLSCDSAFWCCTCLPFQRRYVDTSIRDTHLQCTPPIRPWRPVRGTYVAHASLRLETIP